MQTWVHCFVLYEVPGFHILYATLRSKFYEKALWFYIEFLDKMLQKWFPNRLILEENV